MMEESSSNQKTESVDNASINDIWYSAKDTIVEPKYSDDKIKSISTDPTAHFRNVCAILYNLRTLLIAKLYTPEAILEIKTNPDNLFAIIKRIIAEPSLLNAVINNDMATTKILINAYKNVFRINITTDLINSCIIFIRRMVSIIFPLIKRMFSFEIEIIQAYYVLTGDKKISPSIPYPIIREVDEKVDLLINILDGSRLAIAEIDNLTDTFDSSVNTIDIENLIKLFKSNKNTSIIYDPKKMYRFTPSDIIVLLQKFLIYCNKNDISMIYNIISFLVKVNESIKKDPLPANTPTPPPPVLSKTEPEPVSKPIAPNRTWAQFIGWRGGTRRRHRHKHSKLHVLPTRHRRRRHRLTSSGSLNSRKLRNTMSTRRCLRRT